MSELILKLTLFVIFRNREIREKYLLIQISQRFKYWTKTEVSLDPVSIEGVAAGRGLEHDEHCGVEVTTIKIDPYINIGTCEVEMNIYY